MALALLQRWRPRNGGGAAESFSLPLPPGAGGILREVLDPAGSPVAAADVTVTALDTHRVAARGTTDPFGFFLATLPPGRYSLQISADGLRHHAETLDVQAGAAAGERVWLHTAEARQLPAPGTWLFDPPHTAIRFIAKHVGMGHVHGRFERFEGGIRIADDMTRSSVHVRIDAASINTGNNTRDDHLRSSDFLWVDEFPYIDFTSSRFAFRGGSKWVVQGSLTMHGVSRSMSLDTTYLGTVNGGYAQELRCAALAKGELHREDYTLNWRSMLARGIAVVGPTVQLELDVQAMHRTDGTPTPPD
ncbi:YceI family protein [Streptomyces sp. NPDC004262]